MGYWFEHFFIAVRNVLLTWFYLILFDPTSPSVKSYQLVEVVSGGRAPGKNSSLASPQLLVIGRFHCFGAVRLERRVHSIFVLRWFIKLMLYFIILSTGQTLVAAFCLLAACLLLACCSLPLLLLLLPPAAVAAASSSSCCCCCFLLLLLLLLLPPPPPAVAAAGANILPKKKITVSVALFGAGWRYGRETPAERGNVYRRQNFWNIQAEADVDSGVPLGFQILTLLIWWCCP